jgi:hypothetical protein
MSFWSSRSSSSWLESSRVDASDATGLDRAGNEAPAMALRPTDPSGEIVASGRALRALEPGLLKKRKTV